MEHNNKAPVLLEIHSKYLLQRVLEFLPAEREFSIVGGNTELCKKIDLPLNIVSLYKRLINVVEVVNIGYGKLLELTLAEYSKGKQKVSKYYLEKILLKIYKERGRSIFDLNNYADVDKALKDKNMQKLTIGKELVNKLYDQSVKKNNNEFVKFITNLHNAGKYCCLHIKISFNDKHLPELLDALKEYNKNNAVRSLSLNYDFFSLESLITDYHTSFIEIFNNLSDLEITNENAPQAFFRLVSNVVYNNLVSLKRIRFNNFMNDFFSSESKSLNAAELLSHVINLEYLTLNCSKFMGSNFDTLLDSIEGRKRSLKKLTLINPHGIATIPKINKNIEEFALLNVNPIFLNEESNIKYNNISELQVTIKCTGELQKKYLIPKTLKVFKIDLEIGEQKNLNYSIIEYVHSLINLEHLEIGIKFYTGKNDELKIQSQFNFIKTNLLTPIFSGSRKLKTLSVRILNNKMDCHVTDLYLYEVLDLVKCRDNIRKLDILVYSKGLKSMLQVILRHQLRFKNVQSLTVGFHCAINFNKFNENDIRKIYKALKVDRIPTEIKILNLEASGKVIYENKYYF